MKSACPFQGRKCTILSAVWLYLVHGRNSCNPNIEFGKRSYKGPCCWLPCFSCHDKLLREPLMTESPFSDKLSEEVFDHPIPLGSKCILGFRLRAKHPQIYEHGLLLGRTTNMYHPFSFWLLLFHTSARLKSNSIITFLFEETSLPIVR